ncbi:hypothetical protein MMC25_008208 [Agyrium rufum]|nr:hypothetical protein [Agyrium rufum]
MVPRNDIMLNSHDWGPPDGWDLKIDYGGGLPYLIEQATGTVTYGFPPGWNILDNDGDIHFVHRRTRIHTKTDPRFAIDPLTETVERTEIEYSNHPHSSLRLSVDPSLDDPDLMQDLDGPLYFSDVDAFCIIQDEERDFFMTEATLAIITNPPFLSHSAVKLLGASRPLSSQLGQLDRTQASSRIRKAPLKIAAGPIKKDSYQSAFRLNAIAAVAGGQWNPGSINVARLLNEQLSHYLNWFVIRSRKDENSEKRPAQYRAPSWSFASVDNAVEFAAYRPPRAFSIEGIEDPKPFPQWLQDAEAVVSPLDSDIKYGAVQPGGYLLTMSDVANVHWVADESTGLSHIVTRAGHQLPAFPDTAGEIDSDTTTDKTCYSFRALRLEGEIREGWTGIVLQSIETSSYRRVAFFRCCRTPHDDPDLQRLTGKVYQECIDKVGVFERDTVKIS